MKAADILKVLKSYWCQLVRVLILQNGQKDLGPIEFAKSELTPPGKLALSSLVHEELSNVMMMRAEKGEDAAVPPVCKYMSVL